MKIVEIFFSFVGASLIAFLTFKWKHSSKLKVSILIVSICTSFLIAFNSFKKNQREELAERVAQKIGEIKDDKNITIPEFRIGHSGITFTADQDSATMNSNPKPLFQAYVKNSRLHVYTILYDHNHKLIAVIDDNIWQVFDDDYEYNYDENGFELVTKAEREVFFQIEYADGIAWMAGMILDKKGYGIFMAPQTKIERGQLVFFNPKMPNNDLQYDDIRYNISPLFKYPREKFLGIRSHVTNEKLCDCPEGKRWVEFYGQK